MVVFDQNILDSQRRVKDKIGYFPLISCLLNVCACPVQIIMHKKRGYFNNLLAFTRNGARNILRSHKTAVKNSGRIKSLVDSRTSSYGSKTDNIAHNITKTKPLTRCKCKNCNSPAFFSCSKCKNELQLKFSLVILKKYIYFLNVSNNNKNINDIPKSTCVVDIMYR